MASLESKSLFPQSSHFDGSIISWHQSPRRLKVAKDNTMVID
jgi:hypothetical protein